MIYVIDNGASCSDHRLYFVEAPEDFGEWWGSILLPWLAAADELGARMKIVATSPKIEWREKASTLAVDEFFDECDYQIPEWCYDTTPPRHRPVYRTERDLAVAKLTDFEKEVLGDLSLTVGRYCLMARQGAADRLVELSLAELVSRGGVVGAYYKLTPAGALLAKEIL